MNEDFGGDICGISMELEKLVSDESIPSNKFPSLVKSILSKYIRRYRFDQVLISSKENVWNLKKYHQKHQNGKESSKQRDLYLKIIFFFELQYYNEFFVDPIPKEYGKLLLTLVRSYSLLCISFYEWIECIISLYASKFRFTLKKIIKSMDLSIPPSLQKLLPEKKKKENNEKKKRKIKSEKDDIENNDSNSNKPKLQPPKKSDKELLKEFKKKNRRKNFTSRDSIICTKKFLK